MVKREKEMRRLFGERELKIIEKQLLGVNLSASERTRLSRDIRPKFDIIRKLSMFEKEFRLKKAQEIKYLIDMAVEEILNDESRKDVKEIWLFGSSVENLRMFGSDIDIAVHFKTKVTQKEAFKFRVRIMGRVSEKMDVQVFEFLPEKVQKSILKNYKVIYKNDRKN